HWAETFQPISIEGGDPCVQRLPMNSQRSPKHLAGLSPHRGWRAELRRVFVAARRCAAPGFFLVFSSPILAWANVQLEIAPVNLDNGAQVKFQPADCVTVANPEGRDQMLQTRTASYVFYADLPQSHPTGNGYFVYKFYVEPRSPASNASTACLFSVQAEEIGAFVDEYYDISFSVGDSGHTENGSLRLPIYSLRRPTSYVVLLQDKSESVIPVGLGSTSPVYVKFTNQLKEFPVVIWVDSLRPTHRDFWGNTLPEAKFVGSSDPKRITVPAGGSFELELDLNPDLFKVFKGTLFPTKSGEPNETIETSFHYSVVDETNPEIPTSLRLRFEPSFLSLMGGLLVGSLVGSMLPLALQKTERKFSKWLWAFGAAYFAAVLLEAIGLVLIKHDSEFRILSIELDPFQLLQVGILGALVAAVGYKGIDSLLGLLGKKKDAP